MSSTSWREDQGTSCGRAWIIAAADHRERPAEDVDCFVEVVVDVWRRTGESGRHGHLTNCETRALPEDSERVAGIGDNTDSL